MLKKSWMFGVALLGLVAIHGARAEDKKEQDPLAELASLGNAMADNSAQAGGSIRAKREVDSAVAKRRDDPRNIEAKVVQVQQSAFPGAVLRVQVVAVAREGLGKDLKKSDSLVIVPRLKVDKGHVLLSDPDTLVNAGSFYLQVGDRVAVRVGERRDKLWEAEYIERI